MSSKDEFDLESFLAEVEAAERRREIPQPPPIPQPRLHRPRRNLNGRKTGNVLYMSRAVRDLTQAQLAEQAGISLRPVNAIENQQVVPTIYVALAIVKVLGCSVEDIFKLHDA